MTKLIAQLELGDVFKLDGEVCQIANIISETVHYWKGRSMIVAWRNKGQHNKRVALVQRKRK